MELFEQALCFAAERHNAQRRRTEKTPYIIHPMEVATIVSTMSDDEELLAAAVLHDTIEDTDTTAEEILARFGQRVLDLVLTETESKHPGMPDEESWYLRKSETLAILRDATDISVKKLWLGDKLANMRAFYRQYQVKGDALWEHFHQKDPAWQKWYYDCIAAYTAELSEYDAYQEFIQRKNVVFQNVREERQI